MAYNPLSTESRVANRDRKLKKKKRRQERLRQEKHRRLYLSGDGPSPDTSWEDDDWEYTTTPEERKEALSSYALPVVKLLALGRPDGDRIDCAALGLTQEHVSELLRMATDNRLHEADSETQEVYAPIHAWRALGELRAVDAVGPLLSLLDRWSYDDWTRDDLPRSLGRIGPAILPNLVAFLGEEIHGSEARTAVGEAIGKMGCLYPEARDACVKVLMNQLERLSQDDSTLNGFLLSGLLDLEAEEALPVIERAFWAGCIDEDIAGDLEEVRRLFLEARNGPKV